MGEYKVFNVDYRGICSNEAGCTWEDAKQVCEKEGGYLTKITSNNENKEIENIINRVDPSKNKFFFHIGLNDIETEGTYRWTSDDSEKEFNNFYNG